MPFFKVGLTGNVGAGKSTVLDLFRQWGAWFIDADVLAREAVAPGTSALKALAARFGNDIIQPDGSLDRAALRHRTMGNTAERDALNAIVHPEVARLTALREREAEAAGARIVVHDVPLLFEVLDPASFGAVVLVDAPEAVRKERLMRTRGLSAADADTLIAAQQPSAAKRARSRFVIDNAGTRDDLEHRARAVWSELQAMARIV